MRYRFVREFDASRGSYFWSTEKRWCFMWIYVTDTLSYDEAEARKRYENVLLHGDSRRKVVIAQGIY